jgi:hypothetical protein
MDMACSTHGKEGKCIQYFGLKTYSEDIDVDGRIILKGILGKQSGRRCGLDSSGSG